MAPEQLNEFLDAQQARQAIHDATFHPDVLRWSPADRAKHFHLHFAKYNAPFALEREKKQQKRALVDALIVTLAFANTLEMKLSIYLIRSSDFESRLVECGLKKGKQPFTKARFLSLVSQLAYKRAGAFKRGYAALLGKLAKELEDRDHDPKLWQERYPLRELVASLLMLILYEAARHKFDIFKAAERRREQVERDVDPPAKSSSPSSLLN